MTAKKTTAKKTRPTAAKKSTAKAKSTSVTADDLFSSDSIRVELTLGGQVREVYVRALAADDIMDFIDASGDQEEQGLKMLTRSVFDSDGPNAKRVFSDDDAKRMKKLPAGVFNKLMGATNEVNGLTELLANSRGNAQGAPSGSAKGTG